jgi:hypothetical protein
VNHKLVSVSHSGVWQPYNDVPNSGVGCESGWLFDPTGMYPCWSSSNAVRTRCYNSFISSYELSWILNTVSPTTRLNAGGDQIDGGWTSWRAPEGTSTYDGNVTIDTSYTPPNPAPDEVYKSNVKVFALPANNSNPSLTYSTYALNGELYKVRLHFLGYLDSVNGIAPMTIKINGSVASSNFNPSSQGVNKRAVFEEVNVSPDSSSSIVIQLIANETIAGPPPNNYKPVKQVVVSGIEIIRNP